MSDGTGGASTTIQTVVILNLVMTGITAILTGLRFKFRCCCGSMSIRPKGTVESPETVSDPVIAASTVPRKAESLTAEKKEKEVIDGDEEEEEDSLKEVVVVREKVPTSSKKRKKEYVGENEDDEREEEEYEEGEMKHQQHRSREPLSHTSRNRVSVSAPKGKKKKHRSIGDVTARKDEENTADAPSTSSPASQTSSSPAKPKEKTNGDDENKSRKKQKKTQRNPDSS